MSKNLQNQATGVRFTLALNIAAVLLVTVATLYFSYQEVEALNEQHQQALNTGVKEAANDIEQFVESRQRLVETFALEKQQILNEFIADTDNDDLHQAISESLGRWFPNFFTFTLADIGGNDLIDDLEGFVGEACKLNIQEYVVSLIDVKESHDLYETIIHPQANNYHFDVMAPRYKGNRVDGVFFVSFHPIQLSEILKSHQSAQHNLALVLEDRDYLIEVNANGARDTISAQREINLTPDEISEIRQSKQINGSKWLLVGYPDPGLIDAKVNQIWTQAIIIIVALGLAGFISCSKILRLAREQTLAFEQLEISNNDLAKMAEEQKSLRLSAEAGEQTKSQFLASMSHEIRTPLNAVIGLTELVLKTDLDSHQKNYLMKVTLAGKNLLALINDILDFSKIEAGKLQIEETTYDLDPVLENVAIVVNPKAEENGNEVIISVDRTLPDQLIGDPLRLGQILINLAGNAAKFTDNGEIIIDVARERDTEGEWLAVSVQDSGIGMTPEQAAKLFKPFVQADQSVTRTHGGTGLGLSISRELVEAMGGSIGVKSEHGKGSCFSFKVPLKIPENATSRPGFVGIDPRATRILVVDDNEIICETLVKALERLHFHVESALSGQQAIETITAAQDTKPFNVVLMDWKMPEMDGLDTIKQIQSELGSDIMPVIMMISSEDMEDIRADLIDMDVVHTLQKPINTSFLVDTLMAIFQSKTTRREVRSTHLIEPTGSTLLDGAQILLAEDNQLNQMVAMGVLESAGARVDVAENGLEALDKLREHGGAHYAVVLMDIQMPEMDGLSATKAIRDDLGFDKLPVLAMTAHALDEERERCTAAGMNDHITKPIDARDVIAKVVKWANLAPASQAAGSAEAANIDTPTVYDMDAVSARLMLPADIIKKLLTKFTEDYANVAAQLSSHINEGKIDEAKMLAHSLKGVTGTLGIDGVNRLSSDLETNLGTASFNPPDWDKAAFEKEVALAIKQINDILAE